MQMQRTCYGIRPIKRRLACTPLGFLSLGTVRIQIDAMAKANEKGFKIVNRLVSQDVDKEFLASLFKDNNFHDTSAVGGIRAIYNNTSLEYTPVHMVGAFKLTNPSLPEIHLVGVKQSVLRVSQNLILKNWFGRGYGYILLAPSAYHYNRTTVSADTDLLTLSVKETKDILETKETKGGDLDVALHLISKSSLPSIGVRFENMFSKEKCPECEKPFLDLSREFLPKSSVHLSSSFIHPIGSSLIAAVIPFWGTFTELDVYKTAVAYAYRLSLLQSFVSCSVFYFLSFNFLVVSAGSFYKFLSYSDDLTPNLSFSLTPLPAITYVF